MKRFTEWADRSKEFLNYYSSGFSMKEIAEIFAAPEDAVRFWVLMELNGCDNEARPS